MGTSVELTFDQAANTFVAQTEYEYRKIPQEAGFRFDLRRRAFVTPSVQVAARLREYGDDLAKTKIDATFIRIQPWSGGLIHPAAHRLESYQVDAAQFALSRNRAYLALDPGLGKTIIAALVVNALKLPVVYICPPFLVLNVRSEFEKWGVDLGDVLFIPDSLLNREATLAKIRDHIDGDPSLLVVDEAHRYKNGQAKRTEALFQFIFPLFERALFLSGTPMPNRPMELFPVLAAAAPETIDFKTRFQYGMKYCAGFRDGLGHWDFSGASHLKELSKRVAEKFMLRLRKEILNLPPKTEEMVLIGEDPGAEIAEMDSQVLKYFSPDDLMRGKLSGGSVEIHISTYRKKLGLEKAKASISFIRSVLEETDEKVLIVGIHKDVIHHLAESLHDFDPLVITGEVPTKDRFNIATIFQTDIKRRLLIFNIQAGGVGFNFTKASRVIFVEFSWVPAENQQAFDRAHRYGQKNTVHGQYLVFKNSIDRKVLETCFQKERITRQI